MAWGRASKSGQNGGRCEGAPPTLNVTRCLNSAIARQYSGRLHRFIPKSKEKVIDSEGGALEPGVNTFSKISSGRTVSFQVELRVLKETKGFESGSNLP